MKIRPVRAEFHADRQTDRQRDRTKPIATFFRFTNAPENHLFGVSAHLRRNTVSVSKNHHGERPRNVYVGRHVKCVIFLQLEAYWSGSGRKPQILNLSKIRLSWVALIHADGRTDGRTDGKTVMVGLIVAFRVRTRLKWVMHFVHDCTHIRAAFHPPKAAAGVFFS
jgi:hypothetical protein